MEDHSGFDIRKSKPFRTVADLDFGEQIVEETGRSKLICDGNGALLWWWKNESVMPEHVDFLIKDRLGWEKYDQYITSLE